jgi:hypothetical protein
MLYKVQGYGEGCRDMGKGAGRRVQGYGEREKGTGIWGKGKRYRDMGKGALE